MELHAIAEISRNYLKAIFSREFVFVVLLIYFLIRIQYSHLSSVNPAGSEDLLSDFKSMMEESIFFGLLGGLAGSLIMFFMGVSINMQDFLLLWVLVILLSLFNYRYFCFSYAAGILSMINLLFHYPEIDVPNVLAVVAVLHLIEGLLIFFTGAKESVPVVFKTEKGIVGGFIMQKYWPFPLIFLSYTSEKDNLAAYMSSLDWWPLLKASVSVGSLLFLGLTAGAAALSYSDIAITRTPQGKSRFMALSLLAYSICLLLISLAGAKWIAWQYVGAVFAPVVHEIIMVYGTRGEKRGIPLFAPAARGLKILEILPDSAAEAMGIKRGDTILSINGYDIQTEEGLTAFLRSYPNYIFVVVKDPDGQESTRHFKRFPDGIHDLGVITVPRENEITYNLRMINNFGVLGDIINRFKNTGNFSG